VHLVGFIIRIYLDARPPESQIKERGFDFKLRFMCLNVLMITELSKHVAV